MNRRNVACWRHDVWANRFDIPTQPYYISLSITAVLVVVYFVLLLLLLYGRWQHLGRRIDTCTREVHYHCRSRYLDENTQNTFLVFGGVAPV